MRRFEIRSTDGAVLYEGMAKSLCSFIESQVAQGHSLARANLSNINLSGINLQGGDLCAARFDGSDLRGAKLARASLIGASFQPLAWHPGGEAHPTRLEGADLEGADLTRAVLNGSNLRGARLNFALLRAAQLDDACCAGISASGTDFSHCRSKRVDFSGANLVNADFSHAILEEPDFSGADLSHRAFGKHARAAELERHLPNRTEGAIIVAGRYDRDTVLSPSVPAMRGDSRVGRLTRGVLWTATTMALVTAGHHVEPMMEHALSGLGAHSASALGIISVVSAAQLARHAAGDWLREHAEDVLSDLTRKVRATLDKLESHGRRHANLVCALGSRATLGPLRLALAAQEPEARRRGLWTPLQAFSGNFGHVVLCDRAHLALALSTLANHAAHGIELSEDITVVRCDGCHGSSSELSPCAMRFMRDGRSTAVWPVGENGHVTVRYNQDGALESCWDAQGKAADPSKLGLPPEASTRLSAAIALEAAALCDAGLGAFCYPRDTHTLRNGRDGTLLVQRKDNRRLDNPEPGQPGLIRPDNTGLHIRNGSVAASWTPTGPKP